jgi:hypothetical protein
VYKEVPTALKILPNWVVWRLVAKDGKTTKVPFDAKAGCGAKANDSSTWTTFEIAEAVADPLGGKNYNGIGFELGGTDIVGIDFDNAVNTKGVIDPYALSILAALGNPYTETSPSQKGLHAFVECAALPDGGRKLSQDHVGIEIYHGREGGRYFTITGEKIGGDGVPRIDDITLPYLLILKNKDKKFRALWLGDTSAFDGDDSSADFALMCELAKLTNGHPLQMERFFGASKLGKRDKWLERKDYRERTINAACESEKTGKVIIPSAEIEYHSPSLPDPNGEYVIEPATGQFDGWFPLGDVSLIGGGSGTGKTTLVFEMLHKQQQGYEVLGHKTRKLSFHVLAYDRGKNAFERTMRRLNMSERDIPTTPLKLAFGADAVQGIVNQIEKMSPTPNVIFIEGLDMLLEDSNKKSIVSPFMRQLQEAAAHFHIALIGSVGAPKTKRGEGYAATRDKLSGSEAWGRNCETVVVIEFSEDDDGTAPRREVSVLPRNAAAEKFSMEFQEGRLVQVAAKPDMDDKNKGGRPSEQIQAAMAFIENALQNGPVPANVVLHDAYQQENISRTTIYRAAKLSRVSTNAKQRGHVLWELPKMDETADNFSAESDEPYAKLDVGGK